MQTSLIGCSFSFIERTGLLATLFARFSEVRQMIVAGHAGVSDLLFFVYLELVSMVEVHWTAGKPPVRMPLHIAMVALARHCWWTSTASVRPARYFASLLLAAAVVVRYDHLKLPCRDVIDSRHLS